MELKELFDALRAQGVTEITFKLGPVPQGTESKNVVMGEQPKTISVRKPQANAGDNVRMQYPGFYEMSELERICGVTRNIIYPIIKGNEVASVKYGKTNFYKLMDIYDIRSAYELDILKNDGQRPGNVKFFADRMLDVLTTSN